MAAQPGKVDRIRHTQLALLGLLILTALIVVNLRAVPTKAASLDTPNHNLLFGDNLTLNDSNDVFLTDSALRAGLQNVHTQIIRLPVRGPNPNQSGIANFSAVQQAAQDIKAMGLVPLIILRNPNDPSLLADDTQVVTYINGLFGNSIVYYEFANETDITGNTGSATASAYVAAWNKVVPQLKTIEPSAQFIGPVNFQYDPTYLSTFLAGANPLPDAISWHEYTCNAFPNDGSSIQAQETNCLNHINNDPGHDWPSHISAARTLMTNTIGKQLPIWITEWNYAPVVKTTVNGVPVIDPKASDTNFLTQWTTTALETLASNNVATSLHFNVDGLLPLVNNDGSVATEGAAFQSEYLNLVGNGTPTPTPPVGNVIGQDTFQRADQTLWGTASDGQTWGGDANTGGNFSLANNAGQITVGSGTAYNAVLGATASDAEVLFSGSISGFNNSNLGATLRWTDTNNWYKAYIDGTSLVIQKKVSGTATTLTTIPFAASTGTSYSIRFQALSTNLSAKVWPSASPEPSGWMATTSDSTFSSGLCGLRIQVLNGATATVTSFLAQVPSTSGATVGQDTFQRANQALWGTASDGQTWGGDANTGGNFSIANNAGQITVGSGTAYNAVLGATASDAEVLFSGSMSGFNNSNLGATLRWTDTNNWYKAYIDGTSLVIQKKVGGTATTLTTIPFAASTNTSYSIRFQAVGTNLSAKVWPTTNSEPSGWMATASDSSFSSGLCGLRIQVLNGAMATVTSFQATQVS